jgi:membrane-bound lytic murein transglycosylase D
MEASGLKGWRGGWVMAGGLALLAPGCAHAPAAAPATAPRPEARAEEDPVVSRIARADGHLSSGLAELQGGHLSRARQEFDAAVDAYLTAPGGAYADPRLTAAFRRTLEAIHVREIEALVAGDGFQEAPAEPASFDEVIALAVDEQPPTEETRREAEEAVKEEHSDFPIELNDKVLRCIDLYKGRLRDWFAEALVRGGRYLPRIQEIFAEEGIPRDLAYLAMVESAFKNAALSRAKAKGMFQFISATGRRYGLQQDWWVDERSDPEKAARAAAQYLKALHAMFDDWNLALAGYNAGEAKVRRAIARYRSDDFWVLSETRGLRRETKNYVPLIHAAIVVAKAPGKHGFGELAAEEPLPFETAPVTGAVDLRVIAECIETPVETIRGLNPQLRRLATPAARTFDLRVPPGTAEAVAGCLRDLPADKRVHFRTHVVARGQTLSSIASRYGARTRDIAEANGLPLNRRLSIGTELMIPIEPGAATASVRRASTPPRAAAPRLPEATPVGVRIAYRIKPGDTLSQIASQYGTTVQQLKSWNGLRTTRIAAGNVLTIYAARKF